MGARDFIGRRGDLSELEALLDRTAAGRGELVLLPGEAGIGKTRLAEEVAERARRRDLQVAWAGCSEAEFAPAFWPWTQLLRGLARGPGAPSPPAPLAQLLAEPRGSTAEDRAVDPELARRELFEAVVGFLGEVSRRRPVLLVIDDLHWADAPSVRLLGFVAPALRALPVLVTGTYRDVDAGPDSPFLAALGDLVRHGRELPLAGFTRAEIAELVTSATGSEPSEGTVATLERHTGGNPLFLKESVRLLGGQGHLDALRERDIPDVATFAEGVRGVLRRRVAGLSDGCRHLLGIGSGLGTEFGVNLLAETTGHSSDDLLRWIDEAVRARVVHETGVGHYAFGHALIRAVIYEELGLARRVRLHQQLGETLETRVARGVTVEPADLAQHFLLAAPGGNAAKAVRYAILAGERAMAMLAYEDAVRLYEQALAAHELDPKSGDRLELLLRLGEARMAAGGVTEARSAFEEAAALARAAGRADELARAALGLGSGPGGFEVPLHDRVQVDVLEEALASLPDEPSARRAGVMARLSVALAYSPADARRLSLGDAAVAMARDVGDRSVLAYALAAHCDAIAGPLDSDARREEATEIIELASGLGDRGMELLGRRLRFVALLELGETTAARLEAEAFARSADTLRQPLYQWYAPLWEGMWALMDGRLDDCDRASRRAEEIGARAASVNAKMLVGSQRWILARERGDYDEMLAVMENIFGLVWELGPEGWVAMALSYGHVGRRAEAEALLNRAAAGEIPDRPSTSEWVPMMAQLADLVGLLGGHPVAPIAYRLLLPHRHRFAIDGIGASSFGSVERALGILAAATGDRQAAEEHFDTALAANRRAGGRLLVAHTLRDAGRALGEPRWLAEAQALYREMGIGHQVDALTGLLGPDPHETAPAKEISNVFRAQGELWTLAFAGTAVQLKEAKGLHDLATLLARPGVEVHVLDLVGGPATARGPRPHAAGGLHQAGHVGPVIDEAARAQYRARLAELESDIEEAESAGDSERAARAKVQREFLVDELSAAFGLGGRARRTGDPTERARSTVTQRIRDVLTRIERVHPELGRHLRRSVRTGTFCVYDPAEPESWTL